MLENVFLIPSNPFNFASIYLRSQSKEWLIYKKSRKELLSGVGGFCIPKFAYWDAHIIMLHPTNPRVLYNDLPHKLDYCSSVVSSCVGTTMLYNRWNCSQAKHTAALIHSSLISLLWKLHIPLGQCLQRSASSKIHLCNNYCVLFIEHKRTWKALHFPIKLKELYWCRTQYF